MAGSASGAQGQQRLRLRASAGRVVSCACKGRASSVTSTYNRRHKQKHRRKRQNNNSPLLLLSLLALPLHRPPPPPTRRAMRQPLLHRRQMVLRRQRQPPLTQRTQQPLRIELPYIRVPRKQRIPLIHRIRIPCSDLFRQAGLAMRVPWDGTVRAVRPEPDPLVARGAEDAVRLEGGDVWVGAEVRDALVFGAFGAPALGVGCAAP